MIEAILETSVGAAGDPRWARIVARDRSADGQFWYSVLTTGVYCRPSCPSRAANPKNVALHDTLQAARATGFRPCKRCRPDEAPRDARAAALIAQACRTIEQSVEPPSLEDLSAAAGLSGAHFHRLFKTTTGLTPKAYADACRAARVRQALAAGAPVTQALHDSGFASSGRFYEKAPGMLGMKPSRYRAGGAGETLRFAVGQSSLGAILAASSDTGVVAIFLGDDPEALIAELQRRFPTARLIGGEEAYERLVAQVVGFVEQPSANLDLPLDIRGTAFQRRVWQALCKIPLGQTASYAEIAQAIGAPKAIRAVGGACAANPISLAIPCHRVVRTDGALSGYAWGLERKQALIEREAKG
jgi:AraC family transcriptional regulator of adaptative response/methylated-DNA-[protein]-cysteine methyltransferase